MASVQPQPVPDGTVLDLRGVLEGLVSSRRIEQRTAEEIIMAPRGTDRAHLHPLQVVALHEIEDLARPGRILDIDALTEWLGEWAGQPVYHIDPLKINVAAVTAVMSYAFAQRHKILAVEVRKDEVVIVSAQPFLDNWEEGLGQVVRKQITRMVANPADIHRFTIEFYRLSESVSGATADDARDKGKGTGNFEQLLQLGDLKAPDANDQHIVNIVDWLLQYAFQQRASDIHLEPRRDSGRVRFRIDGVLHQVYDFPAQVMTAVTARLKILGRMDLAEKRRPQDGRLKTRSPEGNEVELRLSTLPTAFGEKMVMRIFDPEVLLKTSAELGFGSEDYQRWLQIVSQPNGIILVTGPTGSGKTTTLYSTLKSLATPEVNLCTIEDPIEMVEPAFNQMQVQHNIDLTFAAGVRALLRQDPDIIMVGEIRDLETAEMAVQAALTGHVVFSTLHTNDAPSAITRLLEIGVAPYLVKSAVAGIMAQRLVRTLCPHCKTEGEVRSEDWEMLVRPWSAAVPKKVMVPVGCLECRDTGYLGRAGLFEILPMSETIGEMIHDDPDIAELRRVAYKEGMHTLRLSGAYRVAAGETTIEEVLRVTPSVQVKSKKR